MSIIKVKTGGITADAVTDALIADDVVGTEHLTANEVDTTALGADAVTAAQIADDAISDEHLDPTAITGQTAETSVADDDLVLLSDTSASAALKKMTVANLVANAGGGKLLQSSLTTANTEQTISSATFADLTGMTVNITPVSSTSVFLITAHLNVALLTTSGGSADIGFNSEILRDSTSVVNNAVTSSYGSIYYHQGSSNLHLFDTIVGVDDHNTSSQVTIKVVGREPDGNTCKFNLGGAKKSYLLVQEIET